MIPAFCEGLINICCALRESTQFSPEYSLQNTSTKNGMDSTVLLRLLTQQEEFMGEICNLLRQPIPTLPMPGIVTHSPPSFISMPGKYDGSPGKCQGFLMQCSKYIEHNPTIFSTDKSRVDFVVSLLTGKALDWATAMWTANSTELRSETHFHTLFKEVFDHSPSSRPIGDLLIELHQGRNSAAEYAFEFRTMAAGSEWNEAALHTVYRRGLAGKFSASEVGAILSQRVGTPSKSHICAFFSRKLSPAERNYDVGNRELLSVKLALEEWRHWLKGANIPSQIIVIWNISEGPRETPDKPAGLYSSHASIFMLLTSLERKT